MENENRKVTNKYIDNIIPIFFILSVPFLNSIYTIVNRFNGSAYNLVTIIDDKIPFIKYFILPYNLWYVFLLISLFYLCLKDRKVFYKTIIAIDIGLLCCYVVYIVFQTTVPRPQLLNKDIFTRLVGFTYKLDQPYNCFPSIHVLTCFLIMKGYRRSCITEIKTKIIVFTSALTIIASTLFVKQHVVLDAAASVVLGDIVSYLSQFIDEGRIITWIKKLYSSLTMKKKLET